MRRHELTDGEWRLVEPLLPRQARGGRWNDHRTTLSGMLWVLRTGAPWRDLPERFGRWQSARQFGSDDVLERLSWLMSMRGVQDHVRSDNGSEFTAKAVRTWLGEVGVKTLYIEPGSPGRTATWKASTASCVTSC
jgi:transposase